tara:strand:+ start:113 stop:544 length:432 start_codon:yes stop_codon:yes gene_type:complete
VTVATFDGPSLTIQLPSVEPYDAQRDLYSAWKQWAGLSDNLKYLPAFDTTGGDVISEGQTIAPYFFCRNDLGWRIKMPDDDGEIVLAGNIFARDSNETLFQQSPGYDAFLRLEVSSRAVVIESGVSGLTPAESALLKLIPALL